MASKDSKKVYGLIIPGRGLAKKKSSLKPNIFGEDSDEEEVPTPGKKFGLTNNTRLKTQTQLEIQKALDDDPTVYEYDTIYDDMQQKKTQKLSGLSKDKEKKSKYINNLLKAAEDRKKEDERRKERTVQKERDEEAAQGLFEDKEQFVTSAYKQKLIELEQAAEDERRKAAIEDAMDVTKQKDLSGFYRHFLNQQTGEEEIPDNTKPKFKDVVKTESTEDTKPDVDRLQAAFEEDRDDSRSSSSDSDSGRSRSSSPNKPHIKTENKPKTSYRGRHGSSDDDSRDKHGRRGGSRSEEVKHRSKSPHRSHRSRRSRSRSRSPTSRRSPHHRKRSRSRSKDRKRKERRRSQSRERSSEDRNKSKDKSSSSSKSHQERRKKRSHSKDEPKVANASEKDSHKGSSPKNEQSSLLEKFAKRNVGSSVDDARARYLARKKQRSVGIEAEEN